MGRDRFEKQNDVDNFTMIFGPAQKIQGSILPLASLRFKVGFGLITTINFK